MEFTCNPVTKVSKGGSAYTALEIVFPNGYKKLVFLTPAEKFLVDGSK